MVLSVKKNRSVWQHRSRTKPAINHPPGKNVLQHRTPVISECLSKSAGFIDSSQSIQLQWDDFYLLFRPSRAFHIPGKVAGTYRHRLYGLPRIPLPGHTRKITFVTMMSTFKFSLRLELVVCRDFIFFIQEVFVFCFILSHSLPLFLLILSNNVLTNSAIPVLTMILIVRIVPSSITALWMPVLKNGFSSTLNLIEGELPNEIPSHSCQPLYHSPHRP